VFKAEIPRHNLFMCYLSPAVLELGGEEVVRQVTLDRPRRLQGLHAVHTCVVKLYDHTSTRPDQLRLCLWIPSHCLFSVSLKLAIVPSMQTILGGNVELNPGPPKQQKQRTLSSFSTHPQTPNQNNYAYIELTADGFDKQKLC